MKPRRTLLAWASVFLFTFLGLWLLPALARLLWLPSSTFATSRRLEQHRRAGNATLGFEAVLAVTPHTIPARLRWRQDGMVAAAALTGLDIGYATQPAWNESDVHSFVEHARDGGDSPTGGAALAWLGHLYTLRRAVANGHSTALILEDDVDWDVAVKLQAVDVAKAIWNLSHPRHVLSWGRFVGQAVERDVDEELDDAPYGLGWDVLWLGHCGSAVPEDKNSIYRYNDSSLPPVTQSAVKEKGVRFVYQSGSPVCSFAYAVTKESAEKILRLATGNSVAFDVWLHFACERGQLKCFAVNPELFHQHEMAGAHDSLINGLDSGNPIEFEKTNNVWHSARCNVGSNATVPISCSRQYDRVEEAHLEDRR
ncbi:hypothetical protein IWZ03DRAFT_417923 [Phyllosticta citriasiana]|uniref:Glycosyltransferase family 25 protein n=2 Tax=Phyllosticta citriasiana TaxID=595635 RepID=A0ABR1KBB2_9PEZI